MKRITRFYSIYFCWLLAVFSCNSQDRTTAPHPTMTRTQGTTSGHVSCELQDKNGNTWFSTGGEGVYVYNGRSFINYTTKEGLCSNGVTAIIQDPAGNILLGTDQGICKYNGKSFSSYFETDSLNHLHITDLLIDKTGNLWFSTLNKGVFRHDGKTISNFLYNADPVFNLGETSQLIMCMIEDKNGCIWFCSWNGGGVWKYNGATFTNLLPSDEYYATNQDERSGPKIPGYTTILPAYLPQEHISDDMIFYAAEDRDGQIWFATRRHGVCIYDGQMFTSLTANEGFESYGITAIVHDKQGNVWLGTDKNGVYCYDKKTFRHFTTADGLVNNSVRSILEDKNGNIWLGTRGFGLSRYDGKTFTTFSE